MHSRQRRSQFVQEETLLACHQYLTYSRHRDPVDIVLLVLLEVRLSEMWLIVPVRERCFSVVYVSFLNHEHR